MIKTQYEFIEFVKIDQKPKTAVYECRNLKSNLVLGIVRWYGAWRQYCFEPTGDVCAHDFGSVVFNASCLLDIVAFIKQLPRAQRPKPSERGGR